MRSLARFALSIGVAVALLSGCDGSQSPIAAPGAVSAALSGIEASSVREAKSYKRLYSFYGGKGGRSDGANPEAGLTVVNADLYGTTEHDGLFSGGTIFSVSTAGRERVRASLPGRAYPRGGVIALNGRLYGTTSEGASGWGSAFSWRSKRGYRLLHSFRGPSTDGDEPVATLIAVNGAFYGTTELGGSGTGCGKYKLASCGTVFVVKKSGAETVLYNFQSVETGDGSLPTAALSDLNGTLYGTTSSGGSAYLCGTVFSMSTTGVENVLHSFDSDGSLSDGCTPQASLVAVNGMLFGTTVGGGAYGGGTVFSVSTTGEEQVLHSFGYGCPSACSDGAAPFGGLIDVNGALYGTTEYGGAYNKGSVYSVTTAGAEQVLYSFGSRSSDGTYPLGNLVDLNGVLYGTTSYGGSYNDGTIFAFTP
jgi:uncharacterized repeat protein (TIGR03803 family)